MGALERTSERVLARNTQSSEENPGIVCDRHHSDRGSAVLQRVAEGIRFQGIHPAHLTRIERSFARLIANDRVVVTKIWTAF